jgi:hypothetical protein
MGKVNLKAIQKALSKNRGATSGSRKTKRVERAQSKNMEFLDEENHYEPRDWDKHDRLQKAIEGLIARDKARSKRIKRPPFALPKSKSRRDDDIPF